MQGIQILKWRKMEKRIKKIFERIKSLDYYLIMHLALICYYALTFWVICSSAFAADDMLNANARAMDYIPGDSVLKLTWRQFFVWFEKGRLFPFANYCYILFAYVPSRFAYKFLIVVSIYLNNLLFGKCVKKISSSKALELIAICIFPVCIQLTAEFDGSLYCYQMLVQSTLMWMLASTLCVIKYIDKKREDTNNKSSIWYLVAGSFFLLVSLGTYETAFLLVAFMGIAIWAYTGNFKKTIVVLIPNIITYIIMVIANILMRIYMPSTYGGTEASFDPQYMLSGYLKQLYSTFPLARYLHLADEKGSMLYTKDQIFEAYRWYDLLTVITFAVIILFLSDKLLKRKEKIKNVPFLLTSGMSLMLLPPILIAVSARYQKQLDWGTAHISGYVQSFGLALIVISLFIILLRRASVKVGKIVIGLFVMICIPIILFQEVDARISVEGKWNWFQYPRDNVISAAKMGIFDEIGETDILLPLSDHYFEFAEPDLFYTFAAKKQIHVEVKSSIISKLDSKTINETKYDLKKSDKKYYGIVSAADVGRGYVILGSCVNVISDDNKNLVSVNVDSALVYVKSFESFTLSYISGENEKFISSDEMELVKKSGESAIYRINNVDLNILTAIIN